MHTDLSATTACEASILPRGLLLSRDPALGEALTTELRPVLAITLVTDAVQDLLHAVHDQDIRALFIQVTTESAERDMDIVVQLRRTHPEIDIYLILAKKDPDLLLQGLRLGVRDCIVPASGESSPFLQAVQRSLQRRDRATGCNGFVYGCYSLKGGQGVTTVSVNLADQIQQLTGGRVLLLDLNLYLGDMRTLLSLSSEFSPFDLIRDLSRMDENLLFSSLFHHPCGFHVLPAAVEISDAEQVHREQVAGMLQLLKRYFTHIVLDLPHDLSERTLAAIEETDRVVMLVEPGLVSVKSAQKVLTFFQELNYNDERIALVLNRADRKGSLQPEDVEMVLKHRLFATIGNDWTAFEQAAGKGEPLRMAHAGRRVNRDLCRLAVHLTGMMENGEKHGLRKRLSALFSRS